nr:MAG TPA: hypothetical protein [Caudoviricetes sp.]
MFLHFLQYNVTLNNQDLLQVKFENALVLQVDDLQRSYYILQHF